MKTSEPLSKEESAKVDGHLDNTDRSLLLFRTVESDSDKMRHLEDAIRSLRMAVAAMK